MTPSTAELTLELRPAARVDVIDVKHRIAEQYGDILAPYPRALYCSYHTTAGYLDEKLCARLHHDPDTLRTYLRAFQELFPAGASYRHDDLEQRVELSEAERAREPRNADSHLTFIGAGLQSCVSYENRADHSVYFVDLDGVNGPLRRQRRSTVIGYHEEVPVEEIALDVPVSNHAIDSINLRDTRVGLYDQLQRHVDRLGIDKGWIELSLEAEEQHAGLTVNEFETLLMRHDLVEVLRNPFRFMAEKGKNMLRDPRTIPHKAKEYAKYDLVQVINEALDAFGLSESVIERLIDRFMAVPAARFLSMKRSVRLLVSYDAGRGTIVHGRYQSPILVQWQRAPGQARRLRATFVRFT